MGFCHPLFPLKKTGLLLFVFLPSLCCAYDIDETVLNCLIDSGFTKTEIDRLIELENWESYRPSSYSDAVRNPFSSKKYSLEDFILDKECLSKNSFETN